MAQMDTGAFYDVPPVNCDIDVDTSSVSGKTAVITGGAGGIGETYARALVAAGAFVVIGDVDIPKGKTLAAELGSCVFVPCDVTNWNDQLHMFKTAIAESPNKGVDIVIANAGISGPDPVFAFEKDQEDPSEPSLKMTQINHVSVLYTIKLALHYFRRQFTIDQQRASFLILQGSLAGYLDMAGQPQYSGAKFGLRGMMRSLRRTSMMHGTRVNYIGPWFISTGIMDEITKRAIAASGTGFADIEDAGACLLRVVSDPTIQGHSFAITPRKFAPRGYKDMDGDNEIADHHLRELQGYALAPARLMAYKGSKLEMSNGDKTNGEKTNGVHVNGEKMNGVKA